jgi:hypothetical protein
VAVVAVVVVEVVGWASVVVEVAGVAGVPLALGPINSQ